MAQQDDEFGDASFLMDFDVDAAIEQQQQQQQQQIDEDKALIPNKRRKVLTDNNSGGSSSDNSATINDIKPNAVFNNNNNNTSTSTNSGSSSINGVTTLEDILYKNYGYKEFREQQKVAIETVLRGIDVAIFWATGSGKSICYQLPSLYTQRPTIIVSPLISLMQDQVTKINNTITNVGSRGNGNGNVFGKSKGSGNTKIATYLGSGQVDSMEETRVFNGEYLLIYVTPEKLLSNGFLDKVSTNLNLCLIAIDESHCVSEWGHDFRKEYRQAGSAIRSHPNLSKIPIVALTATAVPRTQQDIISNLCLNCPKILQKSFDRDNLKITVTRKKDGISSAMEPLVQHYLMSAKKNGRRLTDSTIVYVPTRNDVEQVSNYLKQRFESEKDKGTKGVEVEAYHAGYNPQQRHIAHVNFLTGKSPIIVATCAFGMGIDKPDVRRVIHYGPPKTVEEYYQQIGRAGRDGLPSECILYMTDTDFTKYSSDFYIGNLSGQAKQYYLESLTALKDFAVDKSKCRRKALLDFFHEIPKFGNHCGTCDNCLASQTYGNDRSRDFGSIARIVLRATISLREPSMTTILNVISGKKIEEYQYDPKTNSDRVRRTIQVAQDALLPKKISKDVYKEIATLLVQAKYMTEATKSKSVNGYDRSWTVYTLTDRGILALNDTNQPIILLVPDSIREAERVAEAKRQRVLERLEANGIDRETLPEKELETGDGEVIRSFTKWHNYIDVMRKNDKDDRVRALEELFSAIQNWRSDAAIKFRLAPATVLPEHLVASFAYTTATLQRGMKVEMSDLVAAGARTKDLETLVDALAQWVDRHQPSSAGLDGENGDNGDQMMIVPDTSSMTTIAKWRFAVYKPSKKTGLATWETSYNRFCNGESPQTIAMSPGGNRSPIQVSTVVGHLQDALVQGRRLDLTRLITASPLPTKLQWEKLEQAEMTMGMDVCGDPTTSGPGDSRFSMTEILRPIMGDAFVDNPKEERTESDKSKFSTWINLLKWYMCLKRAGITPTFTR